MVEISILSTEAVLPASSGGGEADAQPRRIELTPWDLQFLFTGPVQKGLLFRKPPHQQDEKLDSFRIHQLKASLSRALDFFPPLAGRFAATKNDDDGTTTFFILCNSAGVEFTHAVVDGFTIARFLEPVYVPSIVHSFFPLNDVTNHEGVSKPLFGVQITELVDGYFMGFTMNHSLGDGTTFWHFINSWSELSRGSDSISKSPNFTRWYTDDTVWPIRIPSWEEKLKLAVADNFVSPPYMERVFHFSKESIARLKSKANNEMNTEQVSSLQSLLAHFWRSVMRSRQIDAGEISFLHIIVGARPRLKEILPDGYFGDAVQFRSVTNTLGELLRNGIGWVALQINKIVGMHSQEEMRKFYETWSKEPKIPKIREFTSNSLTIGSSPRFNMYGNDFGWGKPIGVRSGAANKYDGKITLFAGAEEGSVDIEACLSPETLHTLGTDTEFMAAVTISPCP